METLAKGDMSVSALVRLLERQTMSSSWLRLKASSTSAERHKKAALIKFTRNKQPAGVRQRAESLPLFGSRDELNVLANRLTNRASE